LCIDKNAIAATAVKTARRIAGPGSFGPLKAIIEAY